MFRMALWNYTTLTDVARITAGHLVQQHLLPG